MADALEQLRMMSYRIRAIPTGSLAQYGPPLAPLDTPIDPTLHTYPHVVFGKRAESIFLDRTFNPQDMEEARALLVASHRLCQDGGP
ncbi:MAG TPA: hypothetical protein VNE42_10195 [Acidimicrobiales bacterium]|nr:hypothetical protein [Acidimicrobiales bacterium]